jgi:hypothetical protein
LHPHAQAFGGIHRAVRILRDRAVLPETLPDGRGGFDHDLAELTPLVVPTPFFRLPRRVDEGGFRRDRVDAPQRHSAVRGPESFVNAPRRIHAHFIDGVRDGRRENLTDAQRLRLRQRLAMQQRQYERARAVGRHGVPLHTLDLVPLVGVPHHFRAHDIDAPVPLARRHLVPVVTDADGGDDARTVATAVLMVGLAVHCPRHVQLCRPLGRVVFSGFPIEGLEAPDVNAEPRVHRAHAGRAFVDHRLDVGVGRFGVEPHVVPRRLGGLPTENVRSGRLGNGVLAQVHPVNRKAPHPVAFLLLFLWG